MRLASCRLIAWILTAWFAALVGVGEGWHFVPGNGHWLELPSGYAVYVGDREPGRVCWAASEAAALGDGERAPQPARDAENCAVCRLCGQLKLPRVSLESPSPETLERSVCLLVWPAVSIHVPRPFHARAPPQA